MKTVPATVRHVVFDYGGTLADLIFPVDRVPALLANHHDGLRGDQAAPLPPAAGPQDRLPGGGPPVPSVRRPP